MAAFAGFLLGTTALPAFAVDDLIDGNPLRGERLSVERKCVSCHGPRGAGVQPGWPRLEGQYARYIVNQIHNFVSGRRPHPPMESAAGPLSEAQIRDLAAYFACQHETRRKTEQCRSLFSGE